MTEESYSALKSRHANLVKKSHEAEASGDNDEAMVYAHSAAQLSKKMGIIAMDAGLYLMKPSTRH